MSSPLFPMKILYRLILNFLFVNAVNRHQLCLIVDAMNLFRHLNVTTRLLPDAQPVPVVSEEMLFLVRQIVFQHLLVLHQTEDTLKLLVEEKRKAKILNIFFFLNNQLKTTFNYRFLFLVQILIHQFVHFFVLNHDDNHFPYVFVVQVRFVNVMQLPIDLLGRHQVDRPKFYKYRMNFVHRKGYIANVLKSRGKKN